MHDRIRVLHVDDEPDFADLTATYLEREDDRITVETVTSGAAGLELLGDHIDCVLSDYEMPGMDGIDFLETVRGEYPDLPFILYTGRGSEEIASEAVSAGVTDYLQKGHGSEQYELLTNRLTNAVEQARARRRADKHHRVSTVVRDINQALVEATSREEISHRVCQIITDADPYVFAWIGTVDEETARVEPQAAAGFDDGYLEDFTVTVDESPTGRGPGGTAVREDRVAVSQNIQDDEAFSPWRERALERGYRAVAGIPLSHEGAQYGVLGLYADRPDAFDEAERELLAELGDTIAHAYNRLEIQDEYEDQYRELFEEAPVMFTFTRAVDGEPVVEDCNQLFAETLGYTREELRGRRLATLYTAESTEELLDGGGYDRALGGEFTREQRDFVTSDGDVVTTLLRATPRRDSEGTVIGTHALFVDITRNAERLSSLFEQFPEPVVAYAYRSGEPYIRQVNEAFTETFGYDPESAVGEPVDDLLVPPDRQEEADRIDGRVRAGDALDAILRRETRSGLRDFRFRNIPLSTDDTIDGYGIYADITERTRREEQLRQEQQRFQTLFEQLTQPLVEVEYDGLDPIVTDVNPAFEETFGYDADTVIGESLDDYIVPEDRLEEATDINQHVREGGRLVSREVTRLSADGRREFLLENAVYEDGSGGFAIYTDITERKERERKLQRQNERLDDFASLVSHDLRNPLNVATTRLELAGEECDSTHLGHVASALDRMETLIDDLLTVARQGKQVQQTEEVRLTDACETCWANIQAEAATLVLETERSIHAAPSRFQQLLENLVRNAVEHGSTSPGSDPPQDDPTQGGENVTVTVGDLDTGFYVADDGPGITAEEGDQVFEAGYSTTEMGTGFGLNIVQEIVEAHGWEISVTESDAGGARFEITGVDFVE